MKHDVRMLTNLEVSPESRRQGHATELLNRVAEEADKKRVIVLLNPGSFGEDGPDTSRLVEWYGSMGYQEIQHEPLLMARMFSIPRVADAATKITNIILESAQ